MLEGHTQGLVHARQVFYQNLPPKVSCNQSWPKTQDVAKNDLELLILLPILLKGWGYLHMPHLGHAVSRLN